MTSEVISDASHQLRNPLAALQLRLENLEPYVQPGGEAQMRSALSEAARMGAILEALLGADRAQGRPAPRERIDVAAVLRDRAASWWPAAEAAQIRIVLMRSPAMLIGAPAETLEQILDVFLANALRASPEGGRIELSAEELAGEVVVSCRDQGLGMTESEMTAAGQRFWRGQQTKGTQGYGLGLAIAADLARAGGGRIVLGRSADGGLLASAVLCPWSAAS